MGFLQKITDFKNNFVSKQLFGFVDTSMMNTDFERIPVFPNWFFSAVIGQPRRINLLEVRSFAKSTWVQMVLNTIKKEIMIIDWDIVNVDEDDKNEYKEEKEFIKDFFANVNSNNETIQDVWNQLITDIGEIDAGVVAKEFSKDSYEEKEVEIKNGVGKVVGRETRPVLKDFGNRTLNEIRAVDGGSFLKDIDIFKRLRSYYQYSFKNPKQNPTRFEVDEIVYFMMNQRSYELYGFSPVQSVQQVLEILIQSTRWNKEFFKQNAIPDGIVGLPGTTRDSLREFKYTWEKEAKGRPHKLLFHNTTANFESFMPTSRDMEWLDGQKWFFHLVFGVFGVSPVEAGFHENVNQGNQAGQERITVKNAIRPYIELLTEKTNKFIITELLQNEKPPVKLRFYPRDHAQEQIEHDQQMQEIDMGALTINEFRGIKGRDPVDWGDDPGRTGFFGEIDPFAEGSGDSFDSNEDAESQRKKEEKMIPYTKAFDAFMKGK